MTGEEFKKIRPLSKEEYEKHKIKQTILEMQGSVCFGDKVPEEMKVPDDFINLLKEKFKDYNNRLIGYSQECEGTFKIKDGEVTDINIRGITLIPKFKDGVKE